MLVIQLLVLIMLGAYVLMKERPPVNESLARAARPARYLFYAFWVFITLQWLPLPVNVVRTLSPRAYAYRRLYAVDFSGIRSMSLSLIPSHTLQAGLELLAGFLLGFLVLRTVGRRQQILRIWIALISVGVFEAFYGLFELYNRNPRILFYKKAYNLDSVTGTFVNRNHLSGYLEMIIPLAVGLLIARLGAFSSSPLTWREKLLALQERGFARNLLLFIAVIAMAMAVVFSTSRSGFSILVITFILFLGLVAIYFEIPLLRKKWINSSLKGVVLIITIMSVYFGVSATLERFSLDSLLSEERPIYWAHSLKMFTGYPLVGTGLGTFGALAPNLERGSGLRTIVHAHNDYLEYLSELGLIGFLILAGAVLLMAAVSFNSWRQRRHPEVKGLALGGIVSLICILIHSFTDFNLHIPANLILFSIVLPLTLVTAFYKRGLHNREKK